MRNICNVLLLSVLMMFSSFANGTTLEPFDKWTQARKNWASDETEIAYALTRCGALISSIGGVFSANPSADSDVQTGERLRKRGILLAFMGGNIAQKNGMNAENSNRRFSLLLEAYGKLIRDNRALHNNMFYGFIEADFKFCNELEEALK